MEIKRLLEAIKKWQGQNQKRLRKEMIRKHDDIELVRVRKTFLVMKTQLEVTLKADKWKVTIRETKDRMKT